MNELPFFSILTRIYEPRLDFLEDAVVSVLRQSFTRWELILVDDCSPSNWVRCKLHDFEKMDERVHIIERASHGGMARSLNDALRAAKGTFAALLEQNGFLEQTSLEKIAATVTEKVDYVYTDEDKIGMNGHSFDAFRKPDWSPERLRHHMYTGHLSVFRTALARQLGGFRPEFDGSHEYDLILRITEKARKVIHVPEILYHQRRLPRSSKAIELSKGNDPNTERRVIAEHLNRVGIRATVDLGPKPGFYRLRRVADPNVLVSIVIPTRGAEGEVWGERRIYVVEAVRSALAKTKHRDIEIVVVYDAETPGRVLRCLRKLVADRLVLVPYKEPFNFSRKCNLGFVVSRGEIVVFLNDDTEVISEMWLEELISPLSESSVGMTGAHLRFPDSSIQHAGHIYKAGTWDNAYCKVADVDHGRFGELIVNRECIGVTAACCALRREVFEEVGGFCEKLPANFNDVDLSYKVRNFGYRILWIANAKLFHFESRTRVRDVQSWEVDLVASRWGIPDHDDPYIRLR